MRNQESICILPFVLSAANQQQIHVEVVVIFPLAGVPRSIHERQYAMPMRQFYGDRVRNEGRCRFPRSHRLADASWMRQELTEAWRPERRQEEGWTRWPKRRACPQISTRTCWY